MAKTPQGMQQRNIDIQFPLGGLNRRAAYRQQPPYSTFDALNVRPIDAIDSRERGGSRPGLIQSHVLNVLTAGPGSDTHYNSLGYPIRMLSPMTLALGDGFTNYSDTFDGVTLASMWSQASWSSYLPEILSSIPAATIDTSVADAAAVLDAITIDTSDNKSYTVEMFIVPWNGSFDGTYRLYFRLDNSTPDITTDGCMVELLMDDDTGNYSGTLTSTIGGSSSVYALEAGTTGLPSPGWLSAVITNDTVQVFWNGNTLISQTVDSQTGMRAGFGLSCTNDGGLCLVNIFRVQFYSTGTVNQLRSMLVASANGDIFYETSYGVLTELSSTVTVRDDTLLEADQDGQMLYIADYGDVVAKGNDGVLDVTGLQLSSAGVPDWTELGIGLGTWVVVISNGTGSVINGTYPIIDFPVAGYLVMHSSVGTGACSFRVERAPKVYDPLLNTLTIMAPPASPAFLPGQVTWGQVPTGCPLICRYLDRIVFAGAEVAPNAWYMGRQGNPLDWDYSQLDAQKAVAGPASPAGIPGEPITALAPHSDDYLIIGTRNTLWRMVGDPASGGVLACLSHTIGMIGARAWCVASTGEMVFLSMDGLYMIDPGGDAYPLPLSREVIPRDLLNLNPDTVIPQLEYDVSAGGIHIFLTSVSTNSRVHWWFDWNRKTFWVVSIVGDQEPTATCVLQATAVEESGVVLGGRDGTLRKYNDLAEDDCGTVFVTYVVMGPIGLNSDLMVGTILSLDAVIAERSGDVMWEVAPSLTFEGASSATAAASGTWVAGINATVYPAARGQAFSLKVIGTPGRCWAMEQITGTIKEGGRRRIP